MNSNNTAIHDSQRTDPAVETTLPLCLKLQLLAIIITGLLLRVVLPGTTVFIGDQVVACAFAEDIVAGSLPTAGLTNSGGFRNLPGFVYLLAPVWWVSPDPNSLISFIAGLNVLGVLCTALLFTRWIGSAAAWWGVAFFASAPWAIYYSRWIFAQHLLFPIALLVYFFLWQWLSRGRQWASIGVIFALALLLQVHLAGIVLAMAIGLSLLWWRPKLPWVPLSIGTIVVLVLLLPYFLDGHLSFPRGNRVGYEHFWRVLPAAAMSLSGIGWQFEFREGYAAFADVLGWRRWPYEAVMLGPVLLFTIGLCAGLLKLWRERNIKRPPYISPLMLSVVLVLVLPLTFSILGLRTSPTYTPVWYPLPFLFIGWVTVRLLGKAGPSSRRWLTSTLLAVLVIELAFSFEQFHYTHTNGGVPGARLGRSYAAMKNDLDDLASCIEASEVWLDYNGSKSVIPVEAAAYLLRRATWGGTTPKRAVIRFRRWRDFHENPCIVDILPDAVAPPEGSFRVRPWSKNQQVGSKIPKL